MSRKQKIQYWKAVIDECHSLGEPITGWCKVSAN